MTGIPSVKCCDLKNSCTISLDRSWLQSQICKPHGKGPSPARRAGSGARKRAGPADTGYEGGQTESKSGRKVRAWAWARPGGSPTARSGGKS